MDFFTYRIGREQEREIRKIKLRWDFVDSYHRLLADGRAEGETESELAIYQNWANRAHEEFTSAWTDYKVIKSNG